MSVKTRGRRRQKLIRLCIYIYQRVVREIRVHIAGLLNSLSASRLSAISRLTVAWNIVLTLARGGRERERPSQRLFLLAELRVFCGARAQCIVQWIKPRKSGALVRVVCYEARKVGKLSPLLQGLVEPWPTKPSDIYTARQKVEEKSSILDLY